MSTKWKAFNIRMPEELFPLYDFLQGELNYFLLDENSRNMLNSIDLSQHRGNIWRDMRDLFQSRIAQWTIHNKTWHSYILFENLRRELESKRQRIIIFEELEKNDFVINEVLFDNLHDLNVYPTRGQVANIQRSGQPPVLAYSSTLNLDYSTSEKQIFKMKDANVCQIKVSKKEWINYEIVLPSSIDHRFTGKIAKPRFVKRKRDGKYIGICSYEYEVEKLGKENKNILGVDIGKVKLFSAICLHKNGEYSDEYINSKRLASSQQKINNLYNEKQILRDKIDAYDKLGLDNNKKACWLDLYNKISDKIINSKKSQAQLISYEVVELAKQLHCKEIHIENLSWMSSLGGKWNHAEIHKWIEDKADSYGIKVKKVSAFNSSKEHPVTKEIGTPVNRNIIFANNEKIDRDLLASINLAVRSTSIKIKNIKKVKTKRCKTKSNKNKIKSLIADLKKGNAEIVAFLTNVTNSKKTELVVRPLNEVLSCNSLLGLCYQKCQL